MENEKLVRAVGYRRVSMKEQVDGHSLDAQEAHIREYAAAQSWHLLEIYTDAGISARAGSRRPGLESLMRDAQAGRFDVVIVDKIDRFYRHLTGLLTALDKLRQWGVGFVSVQERLDFTTPWGKLTLTILGMLAEIYIDNLRQETKKGKRQRARSGLLNGPVPYGYCNGLCSQCSHPNGAGYCPRFGQEDLGDGKVVVPHPVDQHAVRLMYRWYLEGLSYGEIAERLNTTAWPLPDGQMVQFRHMGRAGVHPPGPFQRETVRSVLGNLVYTGKVPYYGYTPEGKSRKRQGPQEVYEGQHEAIISEEIFQQVAERRRLRANPPVRGAARPRIYPLTGVLRCGICGHAMRGSKGPRDRHYYRDAGQIEREVRCTQPAIQAEWIEEQIGALLEPVLRKGQADLQALEKAMDEARERWERAKWLFMIGDLDRETYVAQRKSYELMAKTYAGGTKSAILRMSQEFQEWKGLSLFNRKRLLRLALEAAYVRGKTLVAIQPTRDFLPLLLPQGGIPFWGSTSGPDGISSVGA